jgi:hypothetical protein
VRVFTVTVSEGGVALGPGSKVLWADSNALHLLGRIYRDRHGAAMAKQAAPASHLPNPTTQATRSAHARRA